MILIRTKLVWRAGGKLSISPFLIYFKKSKSWLYQRLNRNNINGKPVKFTKNEIETFNFAIQDISKKLGSTSIH